MALHSLIKVNQFTKDPDLAWKKLEKEIIKNEVVPMSLNTPIFPNKVRFVCISDTHSRHDKITNPIPNGDVLIHAGDFTNGGLDEVEKFSDFLKKLDDKFRYKVVIAGNNEVSFKTEPNKFNFSNKHDSNSNKTINPRDKLKNCIYLEDNSVQLFGINIFGSPWTPKFFDWAFTANRGEDILKHWDLIPDNTDVLINHGPPLGFGDIVENGSHVGCAELLSTVQVRVKPKFHIFGHIHRAYGCWSDGTTTFINASTCDYMRHPPIVFDIDLPEGFNKE